MDGWMDRWMDRYRYIGPVSSWDTITACTKPTSTHSIPLVVILDPNSFWSWTTHQSSTVTLSVEYINLMSLYLHNNVLDPHNTSSFLSQEYIDMRMYEDHLYINFDKTTGTFPSAGHDRNSSTSMWRQAIPDQQHSCVINPEVFIRGVQSANRDTHSDRGKLLDYVLHTVHLTVDGYGTGVC